MLFRRHRPMHRTVGISPGEGSGREPPPRQKEPYSPSTGLPPRSGVLVVRAREGRSRGCRPDSALHRHLAIHRSPISPTPPAPPALLPRPGAGAIVAISPEKPTQDAGPDHALPPHHPIHRTVGISPGEGPGREPPPRKREPYWPSHKAPAQERGFSGKEPGKGASPGCRPDSALRRHLAIHRSPLSPTPGPSTLM